MNKIDLIMLAPEGDTTEYPCPACGRHRMVYDGQGQCIICTACNAEYGLEDMSAEGLRKLNRGY